jgi:hypothetical protein
MILFIAAGGGAMLGVQIISHDRTGHKENL